MITVGKAPEFARVVSSLVEESSEKICYFAGIRSGWEKWFQLELAYRFQANRRDIALEQTIASSGDQMIRADMDVIDFNGPKTNRKQKIVLELKVGYDLSHMRYVFDDIKKYADVQINQEKVPVRSLHFVLLYTTLKPKNTFYNKFIADLLVQEKYAWEMQSSDAKTKCVVLSFVVNPKSRKSATDQLHSWVGEMIKLKEAAYLRSRGK